MSFLQYYFGIVETREEVAVCCPFPHYTAGTQQEYYETNPSAHINTIENLFHCKACGQGHSELSFIRAILGCKYADALRLAQVYNDPNSGDFLSWHEAIVNDDLTKTTYNTLGISDKVAEELNLRVTEVLNKTFVEFPVFMYDKLVDVRRYTPGGKPKVVSRTGAVAGLIIPFDIWIKTPPNRVTLICAGEKDMAVARSHGFNAITLTGGEAITPALLNTFIGRKVIIVYDNDEAGRMGAIRLATALKPYAASVKNCTSFHEVCCNEKEDITDFFVKYQKTKNDLIVYLQQTPEFEIPTDIEVKYPTYTLHEATYPKNIGKMVRSNVQVVATSEASFIIPSVLIGEKFKPPEKDEQMFLGEIKEWNLTEHTLQDVLHLMDNNFKETELIKNYKHLLRIMNKEKGVRIRMPSKETVYKCYITDMFETVTGDIMPMEFTAYSIGIRLESGKKYLITYKLVPHPYKGQQLIMLILNAVQANDSVSSFILNDATKRDLDVIRNLQGTVTERITNCIECFKDILGYDGNNILIQTLDFAYHTVLEFNFGTFKNVRGYLDTIIVGESRMGKSSTAEAMRQTYGLGTITSLAGNAATIPGLIGGSNKVGNAYQTRAGVIPRNHKGLIVFEEFSKSHGNVVGELTDIRSSNEVRITRVSGTLTLPALVRMVSLTNIKSKEGTIKPISGYPNGIAVLTELVEQAEDIARYDIALVLGDRGNTIIDPFWTPQKAFDISVYQTRIRWVWSRKVDQIIISEEVGRYILTCANILNQAYECHIKIFGTEAWKKLARLSIAIAAYLVSTDDTYEKIIVEKEHVDYAVDYFNTIYNNPVFKLKEYVEHERKFSTIDDDGVALLQDLYIKCPAMILHLEQIATTTKNTLQAATGLTNEEYNSLMNKLVAGMFITFNRYDIIPTQRFRLGVAQINRNTRALRIGEVQ